MNTPALTKTARVEMLPHTDVWMRGDRYGDLLTKKGHNYLIALDKSKAHRWFASTDFKLI